MSAKLKRVEFCVIWRDNIFSSKPVYNNEYDKICKSFLKERLAYIHFLLILLIILMDKKI